MSGTSVDGIDAVIADFSQRPPQLCSSVTLPIESGLREQILSLTQPGENEIARMGELDVLLGQRFAEAVELVIESAGVPREEVRAVGSHGQTIRHEPTGSTPFTLQIGDPNWIAQQTGITTVADFRRRDLVAGGQGAPLAPAYHRWFLSGREGVVANIGGMANITLLPSSEQEPVVGFDTGPGNVLMDAWAEQVTGEPMDRDGGLAGRGEICEPLLQSMLQDPFFALPPPKSTGRESFHLEWFRQHQCRFTHCSDEDVAATLCELTAEAIADAVRTHHPQPGSLWICGGGSHNPTLMDRISNTLAEWTVASTQEVGMDPDWVEAMAFAWLARQTLRGEPGNLPSVTGADQSLLLGAIFPVKSL